MQIVQILEFCANTRVPVRAVAWSALISDQLALQMFKRSFNNCPVLCDMLWCTAPYYTNWTLFKIKKNWLQCDTLHCMIWYSANTSVFNEEKSGLATADNVYAPSYTRLNSCRCNTHLYLYSCAKLPLQYNIAQLQFKCSLHAIGDWLEMHKVAVNFAFCTNYCFTTRDYSQKYFLPIISAKTSPEFLKVSKYRHSSSSEDCSGISNGCLRYLKVSSCPL